LYGIDCSKKCIKVNTVIFNLTNEWCNNFGLMDRNPVILKKNLKKRVVCFLLAQPSPSREGFNTKSFQSSLTLSCWRGLGEEILK